MRDTLFLLRLEHGKLSKLLGLIEDQVALADMGKRMDEELLRLASEYFCDYPDRCHHPKEDLVYRLLKMRDPDSCAALRDLVADHRRLHELAKAFADAMRRPGGEPPAGEPPPREVIREFTGHYRQHIRLEEERFFRLAEQRLSRDDWDSLDFTMFEQDDPLFDHAEEKRFAALRERIEALAEQGKARQSVFGAADGLRGLSGIESFNESMKSAEQHFRLARFAEGGYGLASDRELLLYIPECSAERAAWCAYCYLQGLGWPWARRHSPADHPADDAARPPNRSETGGKAD
ncbi:MAG TPA: hemerythrin domain-containing protein [Steroidobacteraceae bacterium]|nr:hemerythrin domain-containing protein [Steroidobacteraceae bacterium]